jgi:hypothetical protein
MWLVREWGKGGDFRMLNCSPSQSLQGVAFEGRCLYFLKWQICMLMKRHFRASLKWQKSEHSRYTNSPSIQSSVCTRTWLLCYKKETRSKPQVHTKKLCAARWGQLPWYFCWVVGGSSQNSRSLFLLLWKSSRKEDWSTMHFSWNKVNVNLHMFKVDPI